MPLTHDAAGKDATKSLAETSDLFKVALDCPECGESGLVDWKSLKNGIGCPKCGCQFLIGRNGRLLSQADLPHVRFNCPRCKQSGWIPSMLAARGAPCPGCKLPLVLGPDHRLHGTAEAEALWRASGAAMLKPSLVDRMTARFTTSDGRVRVSAVLFSITALVCLIVGAGFALYSLFDRSPETLARRFVQTCLTGNWNEASAYFEDDAVQQASFDRWRIRYFPSILDTHRPKGDKVDVDVQVLNDDQDSRTFLVTMASPFIGSRGQVQLWHQREGKWLFDARGTLAREQMTARPKKRVKMPAPRPIRGGQHNIRR